mmetsp:Transcript_16311/g.36692  ORF Transcript_16311/g.36692 Transcript_16311/m.36692 type:complete len:274 (+) Transcript_16311:570-1391(+)
MAIIASVGVVVNIILAVILGEEGHALSHGHDGHSHDHDHGHSGSNNHVCTEEGVACSNQPRENHCDHGHSHSHAHLHDHTCNINPIDEHTSLISDNSHNDENQKVVNLNQLQKNLNLNAAYVHVLGDLVLSIVVLFSGTIIYFKPNWAILDPICTVIFCIIIMLSTRSVLRSSFSILLEEVPGNLDWSSLNEKISNVEGVSNVHDLHIWSVSHNYPALSVHANAIDPQRALHDISEICKGLNIKHLTIQVQSDQNQDCISCQVKGDETKCHSL